MPLVIHGYLSESWLTVNEQAFQKKLIVSTTDIDFSERPQWLRQRFLGNQAAYVFLYALERPHVLKVVELIRTYSCRLFLGNAGESFFKDAWKRLLDLEINPTRERISQITASAREACSSMKLMIRYPSYKQGSLLRTIHVAGLKNSRGVVVDIGADNNGLGQLLLKEVPDVTKVIGVDIENRNALTSPDRLIFKVQEDQARLPIEDSVANSVVLRFALHHMPADIQMAILRESYRVLKSGGELIVVEDTFSSDLLPLVDNDIHSEFLKLRDPLDRLLTLACLDASSCFFVDESMPFWFSFRCMKQWQKVMSSIGFSTERMEYWGLPFFSLYQAPLGVMAFRR